MSWSISSLNFPKLVTGGSKDEHDQARIKIEKLGAQSLNEITHLPIERIRHSKRRRYPAISVDRVRW